MPSFLNANGSFFPNQPAPVLAGAALTSPVRMAQGQSAIILNNATTLPTLTVQLPPNPMLGFVCSITSNAGVTALTLQAQGAGMNPVLGQPVNAGVFTPVIVQYVARGIWAVLGGTPVAASDPNDPAPLPELPPPPVGDREPRPGREA